MGKASLVTLPPAGLKAEFPSHHASITRPVASRSALCLRPADWGLPEGLWQCTVRPSVLCSPNAACSRLKCLVTKRKCICVLI